MKLCFPLMLQMGLVWVAFAPVQAQESLPPPDPEFQGKIGETYKNSEADPKLFASPAAPKKAPNIFLVLIDDIGFGASSTFGGPISTPTLDRIAKAGLSYNAFHTTALCSPTRAALLTGRNHHNAATGNIIELGTGFPGYTGIIPRDTATIGQILQQHGYSTSWIGKNHNVADNVTSIVGPYERRPNGLGFDYFYGFMGGEMDQWYPTLYENQNPVLQTPSPEEGYNLTHDLADKAIEWMRYQNSIAPDRPFFLYFAPGATHAPHQPPKEYPEKYRGKFAHGWDKERELTFARQKKMGIIPESTKLTPRPEQMPAWESFDAEARKLMERQMETYAGFGEYADVEVGRVLSEIERSGELENTLVIYIFGDNGSSAEGSLVGSANELLNLNGINPTIEMSMKFYDEWGSPRTSPHMAVGWAWAMSTPFRWTKQVASHFGGTRNAMVLSWPARIKAKGEMRPQFHHVNDIVPTILDVVGIEAPDHYNGIQQKPMDGVSMAYTFAENAAGAPNPKTTQYFEMFGHRALYHDGWIASAFHNRVPWVNAGTVPFEEDKWELFNLNEDFSQAVDVSDQHPEKLKELQKLFDSEAKKNNVYPLDDRFAERTDVSLRPSFIEGRDKITFYPGTIRLLEGSAPNMKSRSHSITANLVIPKEGAEGVILAMGGGTAGFSIYVQNGKLTYFYDWFKFKDYTITTDQPLPTGDVNVRMDFNYDGGGAGKGAEIVLFVNGKKAGSGRLEATVPGRFGLDGMDVGMDLGAPVNEAYKTPFKFTGEIKDVTIDLK
ncbi:MAG TPA: arylsulfatase [Planctomicrobium sp.]|nr:arylsulfatase [Planctomicrobium sp.]